MTAEELIKKLGDPLFYPNFLEIASGVHKDVKLATVFARLRMDVTEERASDKDVLAFMYDPKLKQLLSQKMVKLRRDMGRTKHPYHNIHHAQAVALRIRRLFADGTSEFDKAMLILADVLGLVHDIWHCGGPVSQTTDWNVSNEEKAAYYLHETFGDVFSPTLLLFLMLAVLGTSFAQDRLDSPLDRKYKPYGMLDHIAAFADLSGSLFKPGWEDECLRGCLIESLTIVEEMSSEKVVANYTTNDYEKWLFGEKDGKRGQHLGSVQWFLEVVLHPSLQAIERYNDELSNVADYRSRFSLLMTELASLDHTDYLYDEAQSEFQELVQEKYKQLSDAAPTP